MVKNLSNRRGSSLVEVLIALLIMVLGFVSLHRLQVATIRDNNYAAQLSRAVHLAAGQMELLVGRSNPDILSGTSTCGAFVLTWNAENDVPVAGCKTMTVEAEWSRHGTPKTLKLIRVVAAP